MLASASPRRRELLRSLCPDFEVAPSAVDERLEPGPLAAAVARLALRKARAVAGARRASLVLGADTIVVIDGEVLGKPSGPAEAAAMLRRLRGRVHEVLTGVAVVDAATGREATETVTSRVRMRAATDAEIAAYAATDEPLDKAGGYAIQGRGGALVEGLEGSWSNVVGLPLAATAALLRRFGVAVSEPPAE
ncbi:MAG TPA: Maf family protein [Methylomirabilota bacterium]|nr:Maf family protein [Methylomirabilota bacterium]